MPICDICGMEAVTLYECSRCGAKFCDECGDPKRLLCYDCLDLEGEEGWVEEEWEEWEEEEWGDEDWEEWEEAN